VDEAGLSAKTIRHYIGLVKLVLASAIDENGQELFPRKWNHEFLDIPSVENQHQPTFTPEQRTAIVQKATGQEQIFYSLLAGTGLRVGEALGLEVKHLSPNCRTITVEPSCWEGDIQTPKTKNAYRQIHLCPALASLLKAFVGDRQSGLVFTNGAGKPMSQTKVLHRSLHPILEEIGAEKASFHAMRRFRTPWLRKQRAPEGLVRCDSSTLPSYRGFSRERSEFPSASMVHNLTKSARPIICQVVTEISPLLYVYSN
jgi:integrase